MSQLVMIIDDEAGVRDLLGDALKLAGFETITAADAMIAQTLLRNTKPDLLIVDINMPMMDGFEFIERIRGNGNNTPALMLSARADRADVTRGLTLGADDYVTKPFDSEVLLFKLQAILKRNIQRTENDSFVNEMKIGILTFNYNLRTLSHENVKQQLSPKEASLLKMLCTAKDGILLRKDALEKIWGTDNYFNGRSMDVFIARLRKCLKVDPSIEIANIHGNGFRIIIS